LHHAKDIALRRLQHYREYGMEYAVFVCGVFYERFAPGGMAAFQIGHSTYVAGEGDYLMNIRNRRAEIPYYDSSGQEVSICMTSAQDVARFVVAALDLPQWPSEFRMLGERMALGDIIKVAEIMLGQ
jgi:nucleoside-diphosphate-sugar epimerase